MDTKSRLLQVAFVMVTAGMAAGAGVVEPAATDGSGLRKFHSANGLLNRGHFDLAVAEYREFLAAHDRHEKASVARYGLAVCLFRMERYDEAAAELDKVLRRAGLPYEADAFMILGQCNLARSRYPDAAEAFDQVINKHRDHDLADDAAAGAAEALYRAGRFADSIARSNLLVTQWPTSPLRERGLYFHALAAMSQGTFEEALKRLSALVEAFPKGEFAGQAPLLMAKCYHNQDLSDQAAAKYQDVLKGTDARLVPDALFGLGTLALQEGRPEEAAKSFEELITRNADGELARTARLHLARAKLELGELQRALKLFHDCSADLHGTPLEDDVAYWTTKCFLRQGRFADAAEQLAQAVERFPTSDLLPEMIYDMAVALVRNRDFGAAVAALKTFRSRFSDHDLGADALHLLATAEHQERSYDDSKEHCREFAESHRAHELLPEILFLSGENEFLSAQYERTAEHYRGFLKRYPDHPRAADARCRLGMALYYLEDFDGAETELASVIDGSKPDKSRRYGLFILGDINFQRGAWNTAERFLSSYVSFGLDLPSAGDALLELGIAHQRQKHHEEALTSFDSLIEHFRESAHLVHAMFERGQALLALNRLDEAEAAFRQIVDQGAPQPFATHALGHLATIAMRRDDFSKAAELYELAGSNGAADAANALFRRGEALLAARQYAKAEEVFCDFIDRHPAHVRAADAWARLAMTLSRQERYAEALAAVKRAESSFADDTAQSLRVSVQYEEALCLWKSDKADEAAGIYRSILKNEGNGSLRPYAALDLASIEAQAGRHESASALLNSLCDAAADNRAEFPDDLREQAAYQRAASEFHLGRFARAAQLFEEFVARFPQSPLIASASFFCGEALYKTDDHSRAAPHFTRVVERFSGESVHEASLLRLGECLAALQKWPRAEEIFTDYLARFGAGEQWFEAQFGIGWVREGQGRYDEAISAYEQVVARHKGPTAARAQFQIGECLFAKSQYEDAARELLKVDILYAYPEWSAAALYEAGKCFEKLNRPVEARAQFKTVAEQFDGTRWAALASQRLTHVADGGLPGR